MYQRILDALTAIQRRDPAARSLWEIALLYPGVRVLVFHRLANSFWRGGLTFLARLVSEIGRWLSGIEIHPGATIGRRLFIDHGLGVVIGETAVVGDDVTLYHGVTLGGIAAAAGRRHPIVEDGVVIGAGAKVLGPITVGRNARVGANAVVVKDVPSGVTVVGIPAQIAGPRAASTALQAFVPYGTPCDDLPDPNARAICALMGEVHKLSQRIAVLESERDETLAPGATVLPANLRSVRGDR
jgi:serine O-acetyltransferase